MQAEVLATAEEVVAADAVGKTAAIAMAPPAAVGAVVRVAAHLVCVEPERAGHLLLGCTTQQT